jgi:hypothetical protein
MEPWIDSLHKQLWVNSQVINPKIKAAQQSRIMVSNVSWSSTDGAVMTIDFDDSGLTPDPVVSNPLVTGTFTNVNNTITDSALGSYNPINASASSLNSLYFGNGFTYTIDPITKVGRVSCDFADGFLDHVDYNSSTHVLTFYWNSPTQLQPQDVDLSDLIDTLVETPSYGTFITNNHPNQDSTALAGNNVAVTAATPGDSIKIEGQNTWIRVQGTQQSAQGGDSIELSHKLSGITAGTYGSATQVPKITVDSAGHITGVSNITITGSGTSQDTYGITGTVIYEPNNNNPNYSKGVWTLMKNGAVAGTVKLSHEDQVGGEGSEMSFTTVANSNEIVMSITRIDGGTF